jgi:polyisoprenoid-binding protein YceI
MKSTMLPTDVTTWTLDPSHSQVEFGVRHMMISTVKGSFNELSGTIAYDGENLADAALEVEIDAASIDTRNADRDGHLRSGDFFDVETHPKLVFRSTGIEGTPESFKVKGDLTIRGETRPVVLDAELLGGGEDPWGNQRLAFRAETEINRKEFGLSWNQTLEAGGVLVGEKVRITLEVQAVEESGD